jgi:hypothetical protein
LLRSRPGLLIDWSGSVQAYGIWNGGRSPLCTDGRLTSFMTSISSRAMSRNVPPKSPSRSSKKFCVSVHRSVVSLKLEHSLLISLRVANQLARRTATLRRGRRGARPPTQMFRPATAGRVLLGNLRRRRAAAVDAAPRSSAAESIRGGEPRQQSPLHQHPVALAQAFHGGDGQAPERASLGGVPLGELLPKRGEDQAIAPVADRQEAPLERVGRVAAGGPQELDRREVAQDIPEGRERRGIARSTGRPKTATNISWKTTTCRWPAALLGYRPRSPAIHAAAI